jgi:phosphohistidine phosphatase
MKTLILIRHAKSSRSIEGIHDFDRPLSKRGYKDASRMSIALKSTGIKTGLLLTSPAIRAVTTAFIFAKELHSPLNAVLMKEEIYSANYKNLLALLKNISQENSSVMLFGHNPSLEKMVNYFSTSHIEKLPTCGVVCFDVDVKTDLKKNTLQLTHFLHP